MENPQEFANRVRAKFNAYHDMPDEELTQRVLAKFPQYASKVSLTPNALPPVGQDLQIPSAPETPTPFKAAVSAVGQQLRPLMPDAVVQSPIGQEIVKPGRLQGLGDVLSSKNPNLVQHPVGPATQSPLAMVQDTVAGAEDLVGGVIGSLSVGDMVMMAPGLVESGISALLKRNLPAKNMALAKVATTDPMGALKAGMPVNEWSKIETWVNEIKAKNPNIPEAEWEPILQTRAKNMIDEINGVLPELQNRPGVIGPKPDEVPQQPTSVIKKNPLMEEARARETAQVQHALPTAPAVPMQDWQADTSIPGRTIYANASGYKVEVPPGVEPSLFLKTIREVEKAQGEKSIIGEVPTLPTNASPAETLPIAQPKALTPAQEKAKFNKEMKKTPNVQPWAANKVLEVLNDPKTPSTMPKEGFLNVLKNKQVKPDQLEWDGLNDFLKGKEKITKKEVQKFVEENGLNLIEIDKGTKATPKYSYSIIDENGEAIQDGLYNSMEDAAEDLRANPFRFSKKELEKLDITEVDTGEVMQGKDTTSYGHMKDLQLPGGTNYREKRFQLPFKEYTIEEKASPWSSNDFHGLRGNPRRGDRLGGYFEGSIEDGWIYRNPRDGIEHIAPKGVNAGEADRILFAKHPEIEKSAPNISVTREDEQFTSGAYPEPGIVAETRYTDRTIGKDKVLFLEEVQSHMHQAGREQGYEQPLTKIGVQKVEPITDKNLLENVYKEGGFKVTFENGDEQFIGGKISEADAIKRAREALMRDMPILGHKGSPIPNAPFKAGKHVELVMKRMVRQAIEEGKDGIAWTTGQMQKDRYNLAKQVSKIETGKVGDKYRVETFLPNGDPSISRDLTEEELPGFIGKDMATKIVEGHKVNKHIFEGLDLQIGGKWADNLYDQQMVNFANKFFGKWGAKVEHKSISTSKKLSKADFLDLEYDVTNMTSDTFDEAKETLEKYNYNLTEDMFDDLTNPNPSRASTPRQWARQIEKELRASSEVPVPYLKFTPELKRAALKVGFPLFTGVAGIGLAGE